MTWYIFPGYQGDYVSKKTWIVNPLLDFEIREGPSMIVERREHSCGKMEINGKFLLVVAGGINENYSYLENV